MHSLPPPAASMTSPRALQHPLWLRFLDPQAPSIPFRSFFRLCIFGTQAPSNRGSMQFAYPLSPQHSLQLLQHFLQHTSNTSQNTSTASTYPHFTADETVVRAMNVLYPNKNKAWHLVNLPRKWAQFSRLSVCICCNFIWKPDPYIVWYIRI